MRKVGIRKRGGRGRGKSRGRTVSRVVVGPRKKGGLRSFGLEDKICSWIEKKHKKGV